MIPPSARVWIAMGHTDIAERLAARREHSAPLMADLHAWLHAQLAKLSRNHDLAKAISYMLRRWPAFSRRMPSPSDGEPNLPLG